MRVTALGKAVGLDFAWRGHPRRFDPFLHLIVLFLCRRGGKALLFARLAADGAGGHCGSNLPRSF